MYVCSVVICVYGVSTEINNKCTHLLGVTFNLENGSYRPVTKPTN